MRGLFGVMEMVYLLIVMVVKTQLYTCVKTQSLTLKIANFILYVVVV